MTCLHYDIKSKIRNGIENKQTNKPAKCSPEKPLYQLLIHSHRYHGVPLSITALEWSSAQTSKDDESMHFSSLSNAC